MNLICRWLRFGLFSLVIFLPRLEAQNRLSSSASKPNIAPKSARCSGPEYRQFDFWIGDWDAFDVDNPTVRTARTRVDLILDGCVLRENYEGADGHQGQSFTIYDSSRKLWHQSWVTNRGELLVIEGKFDAGEIILSGVFHSMPREPFVRGIWKPVDGGVRETAEKSTDGGKTWTPWFDLIFRPHKP